MKGFDIYETIIAAFSLVQADLELRQTRRPLDGN
jgi:hypothetical protein